eukprot:jgi/Orpsp1_1/1176256/evm.model.c7180000056955.1
MMITEGELQEFGQKKRKILSRTYEIEILIKNFKSIESELIYSGCTREIIVNL